MATLIERRHRDGSRSERAGLILAEIRRQIEHGELLPGQALPSERRLAEEFGVSRAVVQTTVRELERAGLLECNLNCRPRVRSRDGAQALRARKGQDQVAVWIHPSLEDIGAASILQGVQAVLAAAGYKALIDCPRRPQTGWVQDDDAALLQSLTASSSVAGAIVWHSGDDRLASVYQRLIDGSTPLVFVDREPPEPIVADVVSSDNRRAARRAVKHLIDLGHTRIAMVSNDEGVSSVRERVGGYRDALAAASIPFRSNYLSTASHPLNRNAEAVAKSLMESDDPPTAIFAVNDQTAMGLHDALTKMGVAIPGTVSLIGFDWYMRWMPSGGHITTVCQQFEEIGRIAAERVVQRIAGATEGTPCSILLDAPLVLRGTDGPPNA